MPQSKIAIIGAGSVGTAIATALIMRGLGVHIVMSDKMDNVCRGQVMDLQDSAFLSRSKISQGTAKEAGQCDIIIVTAGAKQKPGESRDGLVDRNKSILSSIIEEMGEINKKSIWLVVSNPVDILTSVTQKLTGLDYKQVIGTGTLLDSIRLRQSLSLRLKVNPNSIHCHVIGEHGDRQAIAWSSGSVGGIPLLEHPGMIGLNAEGLDHLNYQVSRRAYDIIDLKGSTHFGIGATVTIICDTIIHDLNVIHPVSCFHDKLGIYLSYPAVLNRSGAVKIEKDLNLTDSEKEKFQIAIDGIKKVNI